MELGKRIKRMKTFGHALQECLDQRTNETVDQTVPEGDIHTDLSFQTGCADVELDKAD